MANVTNIQRYKMLNDAAFRFVSTPTYDVTFEEFDALGFRSGVGPAKLFIDIGLSVFTVSENIAMFDGILDGMCENNGTNDGDFVSANGFVVLGLEVGSGGLGVAVRDDFTQSVHFSNTAQSILILYGANPIEPIVSRWIVVVVPF
jgi:hypothetical protein